MITRKRRPLSRFFLGVGSVIVSLLPDQAFSQAPFYQGKTVTVIVSISPAVTGDLRVRRGNNRLAENFYRRGAAASALNGGVNSKE
jgi:hypothetical protein